MGLRHFTRSGIALAVLLPLVGCDDDATGPRGDPLVIATDSLPPAFLATSYSAGVDVEGGLPDYRWEVVEGSLPEGLELSPDTGPGADLLITGVPERLINRTFTLSVRSGDGQTATAELTIRVNPAPDPLAVDNVLLPPALVDAPYEVPLRVAGGTDTDDPEWSILSGQLPEGLELVGGTIQGTPTTTGSSGLTVRLRAADEIAERDFTLRVVAHQQDRFNITTAEVSAIPAEIRPHVQEAVARWEAAISGNLPAGSLPPTLLGSRSCGGFGQEINGTSVDDILVLVNIDSIDGAGSVLGMAGPCIVRDTTLLPAAGILTLDSGDLLPLAGSETLTHLITHEIGHILGFGTLWDAKDLVVDPDSADASFGGAQANAEWQELGGSDGVPLETEGGQGTALAHWSEDVFDAELMTGFSERVGVAQPLSRVTIASLADLGYQVDLDAADPFSLAAALLGPEAWQPDIGFDRTLGEPIIVLRPAGDAAPLPPQQGRAP